MAQFAKGCWSESRSWHQVERNGTGVDRECLDYVLRQRAGSNTTRWSHSGERIMDAFDDQAAADGRSQQPLSHFVSHPNSRKAGLSPEHVIALRL